MSEQNKVKEFKPARTYTEIRISAKSNKEYVVLVNEFDLANGRKYKVESFLNQDQQFILGV
jgi:hypothetical protein